MSDYLKQRLNQKIHGKETTKKHRRFNSTVNTTAEKRAVENEIYRERRKSYLAKHKFCQCGCGRYSTEIHHKRGRKGTYRGESLLIVVKFFMAVSEVCHKKIERNHEWAIKNGFSQKRNIKTEKQPIMKKTSFVAMLIVILTSFTVMSFSVQNQKTKWTDASQVSRGYNFTLTDTSKKKKDTSYYISAPIIWFQTLYKTIAIPDSVSDIEKAAMLQWITTARPIIVPDTTKAKK